MGYIHTIQTPDDQYHKIEPILYSECSTAADTADKVIQINNFELVEGVQIAIRFTYDNTADSPTLTIMTSDSDSEAQAKSIYYHGSAINKSLLIADKVFQLIYDGTNWELIGDINTDTNTWNALSTSQAGYVAQAPNDTTKFLRGDASWAALPVASTTDAGIIQIGTGATNAAAGNHVHGNITNDGKMPEAYVTSSPAVTTSHKFLREDGTWWVPKYTTNTDYQVRQSLDDNGTTQRALLLSHYAANASSNDTAEIAYRASAFYVAPSTGTLYATVFSGSGASLTNLPADQLTGTLSVDRISSGTITNAKLVNSTITIAGNAVSLGNSLDASTLVSSLGLEYAMHYRGTNTIPPASGTYHAGDVVVKTGTTEEYVYDGTEWRLLGAEGSYKVKQNAVSNPTVPTTGTTTATAFIDSISQDANGEITVTKKNLPTLTYSDVGAAPSTTISCTTANVQSALGIDTTNGSDALCLTEKGTWEAFGNSSLEAAKYNTLGGIQPAYSSTNSVTLTTTSASNTNSPTLAAKSTTADRYYAIEVDKDGVPYVNIPWTDHYDWSDITNTPTTLSGYGITDAASSTHDHDAIYLKLAGGDMTGPINRYYGSASSDPMITLRSNDLDACLLKIGEASSASGTIAHYYTINYEGTNLSPNKNLTIEANNGTATTTVLKINENGTVDIVENFKYSGIIASSTATAVPIWFSYNNGTSTIYGTPVYDTDLTYNPSTNEIVVGKLTIMGGTANSSITSIGSLTITAGTTLSVDYATNNPFIIKKAGTEIARFDTGGNLIPVTSSTNTIGTSSYPWYEIYATTFKGGLTGNATSATKANISATQYGVAYYSLGDGTFASTNAGSTGEVFIGKSSDAPIWYSGLILSGSAAASWTAAFKGTSDAQSTSNAAVTIDGGLGIAKTLYVGTGANITGSTIIASETAASTTSNSSQLQICNSKGQTGNKVAIELIRGNNGTAVNTTYMSWQIINESTNLYFKSNYDSITSNPPLSSSYIKEVLHLEGDTCAAIFGGDLEIGELTISQADRAITLASTSLSNLTIKTLGSKSIIFGINNSNVISIDTSGNLVPSTTGLNVGTTSNLWSGMNSKQYTLTTATSVLDSSGIASGINFIDTNNAVYAHITSYKPESGSTGSGVLHLCALDAIELHPGVISNNVKALSHLSGISLSSTTLQSITNGTVALGTSSYRWGGIYSTTGNFSNTINTHGIVGTADIDYGSVLPSTSLSAGRIFFQLSNPVYELPAGGAAGQALIKNSASDRDVTWGAVGGIMTPDTTHTYYVTGSTSSTENTDPAIFDTDIFVSGSVLFGAAWNDYAEYRHSPQDIEPGRCVVESGFDSLILSSDRMQPGAEIVSDTFGFAIGQTEKCQTPIAVTGRVLAYPYEDINEFIPGRPVCSGPNGTVSIMTDAEACNYPWLIIGTVSAIPQEPTWGRKSVSTEGRVWIRVR